MSETNGTLPAPTSLSSFRLKAIDASNAYHQEREQELEQTRLQLDEARVQIKELEAELEGVRSNLARVDSRVASAVIERDQAVAERVTRETILASIGHLLLQAGIPASMWQGGAND